MLKSKIISPFRLKILLSCAATPLLLIATLVALDTTKIQAQSSPEGTTFTLPSSLPSGATVNVDGSSSMAGANEALKQRFESQFPGSTVNLRSMGTDTALQALANGEIDLAAIGRSLTDAEKNQGLTEVPLSREKIAIIVSSDNPFRGNLTLEQFVQIFRGEITNWSQVGGPAGPIRLIDRPETSDTRRALSQYPVFRDAPFTTGPTAVQVSEDDTAAVIRELGPDGIGYAIASQTVNDGNIRILKLHETLPDDPRYPFSQPRGYVYTGSLSPAAQAFLVLVTTQPGQDLVAAEGAVTAPAAVDKPEVATAPQPSLEAPAPVAPDVASDREPFPWWWLLLPLLGLLLLFWFLRKRGAAVPVVGDREQSRIILTPRNCRDAYAYWEASADHRTQLQNQGGRDLALRLYDVTDISDMDHQTPHSMAQFNCRESDSDCHLPIARDDRDYVVELGYVTQDGDWLRLARSEHVRVPACSPREIANLAATAAVAGGAAIATGATAAAAPSSPASIPQGAESGAGRMILVPRDSKHAYAYWEIPETLKSSLKQQGGEKLMLRLHDVADPTLPGQATSNSQQYECSETAQDMHVPISVSDRNYMAELGYVTHNHRWLSLAQSHPVWIPSDFTGSKTATPSQPEVANQFSGRLKDATSPASDVTANAAQLGTAAIAGGAAAVTGINSKIRSSLDRHYRDGVADTLTDAPGAAHDCRIILVPRDSTHAYAYWEVSDSYKAPLREQGGRRLMLRIHDATNIDIDYEAPHHTQDYPCNEADRDRHVSIAVDSFQDNAFGYHDYIAELGYYTDDERWLRIIRSFHVRVPSEVPIG